MSSESVAEPTKSNTSAGNALSSFHLSLNVRDLDESIRFFERFLGCQPAKQQPDYAKFEVMNPPLVLSLAPATSSGEGVLNHVGIRMPSVDALVEMQRRLETSGMSTQRLDGVECCYARQTKFWLHDPDGTLWEVYTLDSDIDHHGFSEESDKPSASARPSPIAVTIGAPEQAPASALWSHRLGQPIPKQLFVNDCSVDEIHLQGSFNAVSEKPQRIRFLKECWRALKPKGKVMLHQLTSDRPIESSQLDLPGAAAVVQQVIAIDELLSELASAGFVYCDFQKFGKRPCFVSDGIEMRETILVASKEASDSDNHPTVQEAPRRLLFKGPADSLTMAGVTLKRGQITEVPASIATALDEALGDQVVLLMAGR